MLTHKDCYEAVKAQDGRFDGIFFTAVKTTKIYCRPICKVKAPKSENCTFYETTELAEAAGYRPCLRCRPELAPAYSEYKQKSAIVKQAFSIFEDHQYGSGIMLYAQRNWVSQPGICTGLSLKNWAFPLYSTL